MRAAAVELFADNGFHGTGIRDLAQAAKISSASLYHYMGTKKELLAGIMREGRERLLAAARRLPGEDPPERLAALHVLTHATQPDRTRVIDHELPALSTTARRGIVRLRDEDEDLWTVAIEDGIRAGLFHDSAPGITRLALTEMCNGVSRRYSPRGPLSLEDLACHYARLATRMAGGRENDFPDTAAQVRSVVSTVWKKPL